jgi:hypothetical protein
MRFLKLALISVVVIVVVLFALSILLPSHVRISRAINIDAQPERIMPYVKEMDKWQLWNEVLKDPSITRISTGPDWIKTNKFEIYSVASVNANWAGSRWVQPDAKEFESAFELVPGREFTTVQWYFDFHSKWYEPWDKFASIIYDKRMGPVLEKSLTGLKSLVETSR